MLRFKRSMRLASASLLIASAGLTAAIAPTAVASPSDASGDQCELPVNQRVGAWFCSDEAASQKALERSLTEAQYSTSEVAAVSATKYCLPGGGACWYRNNYWSTDVIGGAKYGVGTKVLGTAEWHFADVVSGWNMHVAKGWVRYSSATYGNGFDLGRFNTNNLPYGAPMRGTFNHYDLRDNAPGGVTQYVNQTSSKYANASDSPRQCLMHNMIFHVPGYPYTFQGKIKGVIAMPKDGKWYFMSNPPKDPIPFTASS